MRYQLPRGYRRYLLGLAMLALLCIAAAVTVFFVPEQKQQPQAQYLLKDNAGRLALYTPDGTGPWRSTIHPPAAGSRLPGAAAGREHLYRSRIAAKTGRLRPVAPFWPVCACVAGHFMVHSFINKMRYCLLRQAAILNDCYHYNNVFIL